LLVNGSNQVTKSPIFEEAIMQAFGERWSGEWLLRFGAPFSSRRFGTHLSNADTFWFFWSSPVAFTRWCLERSALRAPCE
jgi:hypothetical protein